MGDQSQKTKQMINTDIDDCLEDGVCTWENVDMSNALKFSFIAKTLFLKRQTKKTPNNCPFHLYLQKEL